jgi:hypothetical protein
MPHLVDACSSTELVVTLGKDVAMSQSVIVTYNGQVLRPETPLDLGANTRYLVTITSIVSDEPQRDAWDVLDALAGSVDASSDWATEHDHYLYGTPKQQPEHHG